MLVEETDMSDAISVFRVIKSEGYCKDCDAVVRGSGRWQTEDKFK